MLTAFRAGASAMVAWIIRELRIPETIDSLVKWDPKQYKRSPGTHVLAHVPAMIVSICTESGRHPAGNLRRETRNPLAEFN